MEKNINEILNVVAFCILMQNNDGILGKSPSYVLEKHGRNYKIGEDFGLDVFNYRILREYAKTWLDIELPTYG